MAKGFLQDSHSTLVVMSIALSAEYTLGIVYLLTRIDFIERPNGLRYPRVGGTR